jgi:flavin-dependent dehydrogenase
MGVSVRNTPVKYTDIAIIGGGLAGSTAVATLGRAGIPAVLIDPHRSICQAFASKKTQRR